MKSAERRAVRACSRFAFFVLVAVWPISAHAAPQSNESHADNEADARIAALDKSLQETRAELTQTRAEIRELRSLLEQMNQKISAGSAAPTSNAQQTETANSSAPAEQSGESAAPPARISEDEWQILKTEVLDQAQEKVGSGSKYHLTLWGMALFNAFDVNGSVDNLDVPTLALPRSPGSAPGSLGASLRQSVVGLTGTGPELLGARTSGDVQLDFFGGLPVGYGSGSSGIVRLRLARIRFDWDHTSIVGGLDTPFFSPNVPTSYMSVAVPSFASAGNLWTWSPTVRIERRFDAGPSQLKVEAGLLAPSSYLQSVSTAQQPTPGESSRQPVYAVRMSANGTRGDRPAAIGVSGIYFPQRFRDDVTVSGWGGLVDWRVPLLPHTELSGEFFGGKGLDSFGGVPVPTISAQNYYQYTETVAPGLAEATMLGGWSQIKFTIDSRNEFNVAAGAGDRNSAAIARESTRFAPLQYLSPRNEMIFVNYVFRPRSDLLFSPEYRYLRTYPLNGAPATASQIGLAAGFLF